MPFVFIALGIGALVYAVTRKKTPPPAAHVARVHNRDLGVSPGTVEAVQQIIDGGGNAPPAPAPNMSPANLGPRQVSLSEARALASRVAANVTQKRRQYDRTLMRLFQVRAGLAADGKYGPGSQQALIYFGVANPPPNIYSGPPSPYHPPAGMENS